jgi:hypothetical protein
MLIVVIALASCHRTTTTKVSKIEMDLSCFGVESDNCPITHAFINLAI